jgi:glycosyltransferase involved in cell wall biosynthesis
MTRVCMLLFGDFDYDNRVYKEARSLVSNGYSVDVISCHNTKKLRKQKDGINIFKVPDRFLPQSLFTKIFNYAYAISQLKKHAKGYDIYHCHDLNTLPTGAKAASGKALIYDSHELFYEFDGMSEPERWVWKQIEKKYIKKADVTIAANDSRAKIMEQRYNIIGIKVIGNVPEPDDSFDIAQARAECRKMLSLSPGDFVVAYVGWFDDTRQLDEVIEAARFIKDRRLKFLFVGDGYTVPRLKEKIRNYKMDNFIFTGKVLPKEIPKYIAASDLGLTFLKNTCLNSYYMAPNKVYDYMMYGCVPLGNNYPEMENILTANMAGFTVDASNPEEIAKVIKILMNDSKLLNKTKRHVMDLARSKFNWSLEEKKLIWIYNSLRKSK